MWILNIMDAPSMFPQTSAIRRAKRGMADSRAMEEQHERHNPVNPKGQLMKNYTGMGATPSMGLSQFRGGKKHTLQDHLEHPLEGFGTKKGQMRLTARKAYEPSEAHMMGQHLSKHIHGLHGAGFWGDFGRGFMSVIKPALGIASMLPGGIGTASKLASAGIGALGGSGVSEEQRAVAQLSKKKLGRSRNNGVRLMAGGSHMVGCGDTGRYEGHGNLMEGGGLLGQPGHGTLRTGGYGADGHGQQKAKRMVGAGVRARADMVKKVMAEKGLKMIEASKYVKEHGLY